MQVRAFFDCSQVSGGGQRQMVRARENKERTTAGLDSAERIEEEIRRTPWAGIIFVRCVGPMYMPLTVRSGRCPRHSRIGTDDTLLSQSQIPGLQYHFRQWQLLRVEHCFGHDGARRTEF